MMRVGRKKTVKKLNGQSVDVVKVGFVIYKTSLMEFVEELKQRELPTAYVTNFVREKGNTLIFDFLCVVSGFNGRGEVLQYWHCVASVSLRNQTASLEAMDEAKAKSKEFEQQMKEAGLSVHSGILRPESEPYYKPPTKKVS